MSTKSSLFLTSDNEHCYDECAEPHYKDGKYSPENYLGNTIYLEMDKRNIEIISNDNEDLIVAIKPGSELYRHIKTLDNHRFLKDFLHFKDCNKGFDDTQLIKNFLKFMMLAD